MLKLCKLYSINIPEAISININPTLEEIIKGEDVTSNQVARALYDASNLEREYSILKTVLDEDVAVAIAVAKLNM